MSYLNRFENCIQNSTNTWCMWIIKMKIHSTFVCTDLILTGGNILVYFLYFLLVFLTDGRLMKSTSTCDDKLLYNRMWLGGGRGGEGLRLLLELIGFQLDGFGIILLNIWIWIHRVDLNLLTQIRVYRRILFFQIGLLTWLGQNHHQSRD